MKETPSAYARRTRRTYRPPAALRAAGRPLGPDEPCPTLFRYPGPFGLARLLGGTTERLAPDDASFVWLAEDSASLRPGGTRLFGSIAVVEPLSLSPCRAVDPDGNDAWLGRDRAVREGEQVVWVPPLLVGRPFDWDHLARAEQVRDHVGAAYDAARERVVDSLAAYLEELAELAKAGAPDPGRPWHDLTPDERRRVLAGCGVAPRWTR